MVAKVLLALLTALIISKVPAFGEFTFLITARLVLWSNYVSSGLAIVGITKDACQGDFQTILQMPADSNSSHVIHPSPKSFSLMSYTFVTTKAIVPW